MRSIQPIEPSVLVSHEHGGEKGKYTPPKKNTRASILEDMVAFDNAYSTTLSSLIENKNPQAAYDHIRQSGIYDNYTKMDGYTLIYSWLWRELSVTDVSELEKGLRGRIQNLLNKVFVDKKPAYEALMLQLETEVSEWFAERMADARYNQLGAALSIPKGYDIFSTKAPEESPLGIKLNRIFNEAAPLPRVDL